MESFLNKKGLFKKVHLYRESHGKKVYMNRLLCRLLSGYSIFLFFIVMKEIIDINNF